LENLKGSDHCEDLSIGQNIILERILGEMGWKFVFWMYRAKYRDEWQAVVNTVMNRRVP
jgi:hypothetical protein